MRAPVEVSSKTAFHVSLTAALVGSLLFGIYVQRLKREVSGGKPVSLLAFRHDVGAGDLITEELLIAHDVPESYVESRHVLASDLPHVLGVRTAIDLEGNQTLAWTDLVSTPRDDRALSDNIPLGMRAMSITQPERRSFGGLLRPGDRVDVLVTRLPSRDDTRAVTVPLLQNVLVLAVGDSMHATRWESDQRGGAVVTLLLSIDQAALLAHARRNGQLNLILRNQDDLELSEGLPETDDSDILDHDKRARRQRRVILERVD
jgi:pilus assembly protein CpaB